MNIRKRLRLSVAVSAIAVVVVALLLFTGFYRINNVFKELDIINEIHRGLFQRATLLHDYILTGNERAKEQWLAEHMHIGQALAAASDEFEEDPADQDIIAEMIRDHEATEILFTGIIANREKTKSAFVSAELSRAIENRQLTQVNIRMYGKILRIEDLRNAARNRVFSELKLIGGGIVAIIVLLAAAAATGYWNTARVIAERISRLREGSAKIGGGDLEYRIDIEGNDEFTDFSHAFNAITEKLRTSYIELQSEIKERRHAEEALQQMNETLEQRVAERSGLAERRAKQLQALAVELIETEERERRQFAHLLHDDLQQMLAAARIQLQAITVKFPDEPLLKEVDHVLQESMEKSRNLSHELSPPVLQRSGLIPSLQWLCNRMDERFGLKVEFEINVRERFEYGPLKTFIFRAVQELLFNVVKHAGVKETQLVLSGSDTDLSVSVIDKGMGFSADLPGKDDAGFGLISIRERARSIGGTLNIESTPGKGSRFTLIVPLYAEMKR
ncbi:MAG: HAMP domain-containing protein [Syntrophales bacterium]|jgi:signal transduction histidine kinase|nr:HAMP domain-containing protein [Syntrophales bacterium]MDY0045385.1 HAMP domain-containing protein [Syntrophales bacterium]